MSIPTHPPNYSHHPYHPDSIALEPALSSHSNYNYAHNSAAANTNRHPSLTAPNPPHQPFTPHQRDLQSLGKDPYLAHHSSTSHHPHHLRTFPPSDPLHRPPTKAEHAASPSHSAVQARERRDWAEAVLQRPEQIMTYACNMGDSYAGTKWRLMMIMYGFEGELPGMVMEQPLPTATTAAVGGTATGKDGASEKGRRKEKEREREKTPILARGRRDRPNRRRSAMNDADDHDLGMDLDVELDMQPHAAGLQGMDNIDADMFSDDEDLGVSLRQSGSASVSNTPISKGGRRVSGRGTPTSGPASSRRVKRKGGDRVAKKQ